MRFQPQLVHHGGFDSTGAVCLLFIWGIDDLNMIRFVPCHHLIPADAIEDRVHDWPLRSRFAPAACRFLGGQLDDFCHPKITVQASIHYENPTPNDVAWLGYAFNSATAETKIHRRLAFADRAAVPSDKMRGGRGPRDQENPDVIVHAIALIPLSPTKVV